VYVPFSSILLSPTVQEKKNYTRTLKTALFYSPLIFFAGILAEMFMIKKVEGSLKVKEIAEGGTTTTVLCDETLVLWRKDVDPALSCPPLNLPFSIALPTMFSNEHGSWVRDLPPSLSFQPRLTK
jgi:hypothetical protein